MGWLSASIGFFGVGFRVQGVSKPSLCTGRVIGCQTPLRSPKPDTSITKPIGPIGLRKARAFEIQAFGWIRVLGV